MHKERRRSHGELMESAVLEELVRHNIIEPIPDWKNLVRPLVGQPFFRSVFGSSEQPLDEVAYVRSEDQQRTMSCIVEIKAMRALDWHDWLDHKVIHKEKLIQHRKQINNALTHNLDGVCIVAVNKDSSEYLLRCYDINDCLLPEWDYEC